MSRTRTDRRRARQEAALDRWVASQLRHYEYQNDGLLSDRNYVDDQVRVLKAKLGRP